jgi:hypothetical protein
MVFFVIIFLIAFWFLLPKEYHVYQLFEFRNGLGRPPEV